MKTVDRMDVQGKEESQELRLEQCISFAINGQHSADNQRLCIKIKDSNQNDRSNNKGTVI